MDHDQVLRLLRSKDIIKISYEDNDSLTEAIDVWERQGKKNWDLVAIYKTNGYTGAEATHFSYLTGVQVPVDVDTQEWISNFQKTNSFSAVVTKDNVWSRYWHTFVLVLHEDYS